MNLSNPNSAIVDLEKGEILEYYRNGSLSLWRNPGYRSFCGSILSVAAKGQHLYLSHESGSIIMIDLKNRTDRIIESLNTHCYLSLQEKYLFIRIPEGVYHSSSLYIWDTEQMKRIKKIDLTALTTVQWYEGNLYVSSERSLIRYDFNISHCKGEQLKGEVKQVEEASRTNCLMM